MNPVYSNDPERIGKYYANNNVINVTDRLANVNAFSNMKPLVENIKKDSDEIMKIKPRDTVPEQFMSVGTKQSKSCNLPGINIDRFEITDREIQNPARIIANEPFRGGMPSRIVAKDEYIKNKK